MASEEFRGSVETNALAAFWPLTAARLVVSPDRIHVKRWLSKDLEIARTDVLGLRFKHLRLPPFSWRTVIELPVADRRKPLLFIPWKGKEAVESLRRSGWLVLSHSDAE